MPPIPAENHVAEPGGVRGAEPRALLIQSGEENSTPRSAEGFGLQRFSIHGRARPIPVPRAEAPVNQLEKPVYVSAEGLKRIQAELDELKSVERQKVAERIHAAMEFGDFTENSELEQAKNDQAFLEGRILTLEQMVKKAVVIDEKTHHDKVEIGSHVMVEADGTPEQYVIVGSAEAAPAEGRISDESPVGKALMGHRAGETVRLVVPAGAVEMKILAVS
jgi:transcription elongation factor GreA